MIPTNYKISPLYVKSNHLNKKSPNNSFYKSSNKENERYSQQFFFLLLESWRRWRSIYRSNKKFTLRGEKVKEVLKQLPSTDLYYDFLAKRRKEILNKKKDNLNRRTSMNDNSKFVINEIQDGGSDMPGSEFSSVKKESNVDDDRSGGGNMQSEIRPQQMQDFKEFEASCRTLHPILEGIKAYANFEMPEGDIRDMMADNKNSVDKAYGDYMMAYKRCFKGKYPPRFLGPEKAQEKNFDWTAMRLSVDNTETAVTKVYESVQTFYKKKMGLAAIKRVTNGFDEGCLKSFKINNFKKSSRNIGGAGAGNINDDFDIKSDLEDSEIKETKEAPKKPNLDFDIEEEGEDAFGPVSPKREPKAATFGEEMEEDAFKGFSAKPKVTLHINKSDLAKPNK